MARIPSEILIKIFQIACQPDDSGYKQAVTPLFIGSICSLWRDVAWSTPLLWNTILLDFSLQYRDTHFQLLGDWLLKARSAPLSIKLTTKFECGYLGSFETIMQILLTRSDYWLTFDSLLPTSPHRLFKNTNLPMLTSVYLHPYKQVRHFGARYLPVTECLDALRLSPNLQECRFEYVCSPNSFIVSKTTMLHAQLKHLHVMLNQAGSMSLFDSITLPSLSNLRIQHFGTEKLRLSSITSLFLRSACNLERFSIEFRFDDADLIACLKTIPSLAYLLLEISRIDMGLTRHFVESLDPLISWRRLLLPNLKHFRYKGPVLCDCRPIVDMLAHRWYLSDSPAGGSPPPQRISKVLKLRVAEVLSSVRYHITRCARRSNTSGTSASRSIFRLSKLRQAEVLNTNRYHITADVQEELRSLSEEGMLVRIESLIPATTVPTPVSPGGVHSKTIRVV